MRHRPVLFAALLCALASSAVALPLAVTESGDFSGDPLSPTVIGVLDVLPGGLGVNTISGDTRDPTPSTFGDGDNDYFSVALPSGLSIRDISVTVSNYVEGVTFPSHIGLAFPNFGRTEFTGDFTNFIAPFFILETPLTWVVEAGDAVTGVRNTFDYTISLTVVPEPAAAALIALGFAGAALAARRRAK